MYVCLDFYGTVNLAFQLSWTLKSLEQSSTLGMLWECVLLFPAVGSERLFHTLCVYICSSLVIRAAPGLTAFCQQSSIYFFFLFFYSETRQGVDAFHSPFQTHQEHTRLFPGDKCSRLVRLAAGQTSGDRCAIPVEGCVSVWLLHPASCGNTPTKPDVA